MTGRYIRLEHLVDKRRDGVWERVDSGLNRWTLVSGAETAFVNTQSEAFFKALDRLYEKYINEMMFVEQA